MIQMNMGTEVIGDYKVTLDSILDNKWIRETQGTYYLIVTHIPSGRMRYQQIYQNKSMAIKYFNKFVDIFTRLKVYEHPSPNQKNDLKVLEAGRMGRHYSNKDIRDHISKAPFWYRTKRG